MATQAERLEIARLSHRFGFGPRPGEFAAALKIGVSAYRIEATIVPAIDSGLAVITEPVITDLGKRPSLTKLIDGDLAVTTDFRDIYSTILENILVTPAEKILGNWSGRTNFLLGK